MKERLQRDWPRLRESIFGPRWKSLLACGGILVVGGLLIIVGLIVAAAAFRDGIAPGPPAN